jgi:hypothetical protein
MSLTFMDTNKLPKKASTGQGEVTEVLNEALCKARNVHGSLRWLKSAETFKPDTTSKHQLIYLMEGKGSIRLNNQDYDVEKGLSRTFRDRDHPCGERSVFEIFPSCGTANTKVKILSGKAKNDASA